MITRDRFLLTGLVATFALSVAIATASANRLSVSNRTFRIAWTPIRVEPASIECNLTLEGSFHSGTIVKTLGALVGYINRASFAACANGQATVLTETFPWHVRYRGYTGTLPNISGAVIGIVGLAFRWELAFFGSTCLIRTTAEDPFGAIAIVAAGGKVTGMRTDESTHIPMTNGCEALGEMSYAGTGAVTTPGTTTAIMVRLI